MTKPVRQGATRPLETPRATDGRPGFQRSWHGSCANLTRLLTTRCGHEEAQSTCSPHFDHIPCASMSDRSVIIGAGPAGLTAAYELMQARFVRPSSSSRTTIVGGIARGRSPTRATTSTSAAIASSPRCRKIQVNQIWEEILGDDFLLERRACRGSSTRAVLRLSAQARSNALRGLGTESRPRVIGLSYLYGCGSVSASRARRRTSSSG